MLDVFSQKLSAYGGFSQQEKDALEEKHRELILTEVIPAYEELMEGLSKLRGTGKKSQGLMHYTGGRQYYLYLLQSQVGTYVPVEKMEQRLSPAADGRQPSDQPDAH